jgi:hypothetical protein
VVLQKAREQTQFLADNQSGQRGVASGQW